MLGVQVGALLEGRPAALFGPHAFVETVGRLLRHVGAEPWWRALPDPGAAPHRVADLLVGMLLAFGAFIVFVACLWRLGLRWTGQIERDRRRTQRLDGATWARRDHIRDLLVDQGALGDRVVLGTPASPRTRRGGLIAVEAGHSCLVVAPTR